MLTLPFVEDRKGLTMVHTRARLTSETFYQRSMKALIKLASGQRIPCGLRLRLSGFISFMALVDRETTYCTISLNSTVTRHRPYCKVEVSQRSHQNSPKGALSAHFSGASGAFCLHKLP